ncbi:flagellar hook-associated protein FlgL [Pseudomonas saudiphocaensis]|uniref:Flagellar hook-associated protein type 3 FlgL n=1 Tax=Pseudomonas saudiphocaensis TaxID=1499686 RepID=A0A078LRK0_9PSED|nr:flagellar hook-associated protein FlgL [Pseudomonas saudiphocaensis]CDZ92982.1 flagellar hook-associated protein type 3 FlgL [Pseudomonas saudiphocaensis]
MRISSLQAFNNGVAGLQRNYANATRTQEQISTGNRILTPADDPVASVRLLQLEQQQNVLSQYKSNLTAANNSLTQEEVTLNSVNTVLHRVRELALRAGNGSLDPQDRQSIAAELREREDELLSLMNTRNARGEYLFSGFQGKTQPFVRGPDGSYSYQGDEGQRKLQIASSLNIAISDSGKSIFENVVNAGRLEVDGAAALGFPVSQPLVSDEVAFANYSEIRVVFDAATEGSFEVFATPRDGSPEVSLGQGSLDNDPETDDQLVFGGVTLFVGGQPPLGSEVIVQAKVPAEEKQGILGTIANLRMTLEDSTSSNTDIRDAVAVSVTNLDHGMVSVDAARGNIGARLNVIETTLTDNEDVALVNKSVQAELRELDYAEALSRLSFQTIILEAAQQSYIKISGLNLFNRM